MSERHESPEYDLLPLDEALTTVMSEHQRRQEAQAQEAQRLAEEHAKLATANLALALGLELREHFPLFPFTYHHQSQPAEQTWALLRDGKSEWLVMQKTPTAKINFVWTFGTEGDVRTTCAQGELYQALLLAIGKRRAENAERQRHLDNARIVYENNQADKARELAERIETDRLITLEIEQALADFKRDNAFTLYPFTLYKLTYCAGISRRNNGDPLYHFKFLWTETDEFADDGYVRGYRNGTLVELRLDFETHLPAWERYTLSRIEDVPYDLTEHKELTVPDLTRFYSDEAGRYLYARYPGSTMYVDESDVTVPVSWVQQIAKHQQIETAASTGGMVR